MRRNKATEAVRWALALAACCAGAGELRAADLKPALEKKLAEVLQEPVAIGAYRLGLDPPLAVLENLRIGEAVPETGGHPLAEVERLTVEYIPSALLLGGTFFKSMEFSGAHFYVGADRRGHSNFQAFLEKLLARREKEADLPGLGDLNFRGVALTFYAPKDLTAPRGELAPDPVTVRLAALSLRNLSAPQPKDPARAPAPDPWIKLAFEELVVDAPIAGREPANAQTARGEVLREGLRVARGEAELRTEAGRPKLLMLRRVKLEALRARSYLPSPGEAETLARIWNTLRVGLAGKPGERAEPAGGWSVYLYDLKAEGGLVEFAGPDPHGRTAYWRLDDLMLETQQFGVGPLARSPKDRPGFLRLESPTASSEGNGRVRMEWKRLSGSHPEWTYLLELELRGLALPALSTRLGNKADAGFVRGDLDAKFSGPTVAGRLDWSGSLTVSQDTQLADPGRSERRSRSLQRLATGEPIQPILITGTLQDPRIEVPDYAKHALQEVFDGIVDNKVTRFVGDVVGSTVRGVGKVLERVPVLGPLFGGDDE